MQVLEAFRPLFQQPLVLAGVSLVTKFRTAHGSSIRLMTNCFDVVTIGIDHKSSEVVGMIDFPDPWSAIVFASRCQCRLVKRSHLAPRRGDKSDMHGHLSFCGNTKPKFRLPVLPEASPPLDFHDKRNSEWCQGLCEKRFASVVIANRQSNVVNNHAVLPPKFSN